MWQRLVSPPVKMRRVQILALNMYNIGTSLENCQILLYDEKKRSVVTMKKMLNSLRMNLSVVKVMNWCALIVAVHTINVACMGTLHQPKVPEDLKNLRKF